MRSALSEQTLVLAQFFGAFSLSSDELRRLDSMAQAEFLRRLPQFDSWELVIRTQDAERDIRPGYGEAVYVTRPDVLESAPNCCCAPEVA
jgi:hypothetical protein